MKTVVIQCKSCGKDALKAPKQVERYKYSFCSKDCQLIFIRQNGTATKEMCAKCKCDIWRTNNQKRNSKTGLYFCNITCKNQYVAQHLRWSDNPHDHRGRKKEVFESANYSCQKCGYNEDKRMLDIHHYDGNHSNNDRSNLRCVCCWCHALHHRGVDLFGEMPTVLT